MAREMSVKEFYEFASETDLSVDVPPVTGWVLPGGIVFWLSDIFVNFLKDK